MIHSEGCCHIGSIGSVHVTDPSIQIVCIEDEPDLLDLACFILSRKGYAVSGASSGREGLGLIENLKPDLVLLDLMMPDMDGWDVYQRIKADPETHHIPVIVITAKTQSVDRVPGLYIARVEDYLTKPYGPAELLKSVAKVLPSTNGHHNPV